MIIKYLGYGVLFLFCIVIAMALAWQFFFNELSFVSAILSLVFSLFFFAAATMTVAIALCAPITQEDLPKAQIKLE